MVVFRCFKCGKDLREGERYVGFKRPYGLRLLCMPCYTASGGNPSKIRQRVRGGAETLMRERFKELQLKARSRAKVETNPGLMMPIVMGLSAGTASALAAGAVAAAQKNPGYEKVRVEGMLKSRWRCPYCARAVRPTHHKVHGDVFVCAVHGTILEAIDLKTTKDRHFKEVAVRLALDQFFDGKAGRTITLQNIHEDTGINIPYLRKFLKIEDDGLTYKHLFEDIYRVKIVGG